MTQFFFTCTKKNDYLNIIVPVYKGIMTTEKHPYEKYTKEYLISYCQSNASFLDSMKKQTKKQLISFLVTHQIQVEPPLEKMSKKELRELCQSHTEYNPSEHGKTKDMMQKFLQQHHHNKVNIEKQTQNEECCSPVNIQDLVEDEEDAELLKKKILHILMKSTPFDEDSFLESKISKLL